MTKTITKIEVQKKDKKRYSIYIDDVFAFGVYEATLVKFALLKGTTLSEEQIQVICEEDYVQRAYSVALQYLSHQQRTEKEVRQRLIKDDINAEIIDRVILQLKSQQYINDSSYAQSFTRNAVHYTRKGPQIVKRDLLTKGLKQNEIENALDVYSEEQQIENAHQIAQKYLQRLNNVSLKTAMQKVQVFLLQKGYDMDVVYQVLPQLSFDKQENAEQDVLAKQAEKILRRLKRKHDGYELKQKLKNALFQKGFNSEDIEQYISEQLEMELE